MGGIRNIDHQIKENTIPLVNNLKIKGIFKNKDREKKGSITDLVL